MSRHGLAGVMLGMVLAVSGVHGAEGEVIAVLQDFESGGSPRGIMPGSGILAEISSETPFGSSCLRIVLPAGYAWRWKGWDGKQDRSLDNAYVVTLSGPYLPPEADVVRMKVRVVSGRAILAVGGPVSQMGNSDVQCDPQLVAADGTGEWQTVELSLNRRLVRNYRRANFTKDLPVVYYTRWAQEPFFLSLLKLPEALRPAEETVLYIDQVELVTRGEGRPFPVYAPAAVETVATIIDFAVPGDLARVVSVAHGYSIDKPFEFGYRRVADPQARPLPGHIVKSSPFIAEEGTHYPAPRFTLVDSLPGRKAVQAECLWAEEGQIVAVKTQADPRANAFRLALRPDYALMQKTYQVTHDGKPAHAVDIVVFVSPKGTDFPWHDIAATDALKKAFAESGYQGPGAKYDYLLTTNRVNCINVPEIQRAGSFGFYSARRYLPAKEWTSVTVPFADFVCVYGQGECQDLQRRQVPLAPEHVAAIGVVAPYGSGHGTIGIDEIALARVPGTPAEQRSFWQVPDASRATLVPLPLYQGYGIPAMMLLDGERAPACLGIE
ncbi:MAG: hypothetical protein RBU25_17855 [Lentisphaeria bacterium]|jgi:hypothetical protein|nr:hypothetical protein [Lentisphaeria bacterium]